MDLSVVFSKLRFECLRQNYIVLLMGEWGNRAHRSRNLSNIEMGSRIRSITASLRMNPYTYTLFIISKHCTVSYARQGEINRELPSTENLVLDKAQKSLPRL